MIINRGNDISYIHLYQKKKFSENFYVVLVIERNNKKETRKIYFEKNVISECLNLSVDNSENICAVYIEEGYFKDYVDVEVSVNKIYTKDQIEYRKRNGITSRYKNVIFGKVVEPSSKKLFITFPAFVSLSSKIQYPITTFKSIERTNKLVFEDSALVNGNYLTLDDFGNNIEMDVIDIIKSFMEEQDIEEKDVIFFGTSKGGSIAIRYGSYFPNSSILAISPQLNIDMFFKDSYIFGNFHRNILAPFFENYKYKYCDIYNFQKIFENIEKNKQKLIIYAGTNDPYAYNVLNKFTVEYDKSHNQVINDLKDLYQMKIQDFIDNDVFEFEQSSSELISIETSDKYLNFEFSYIKKIAATQVYIYINDKLFYTLHLPAGEEGLEGQFYNIVLPKDIKNKKIHLRSNFHEYKSETYTSNVPNYSESVTERNSTITTETVDGVDIHFKKINKPRKIKKILFIFSGFLYHYKSDQYAAYSLSDIKDDEILKVSYQDRYFVQGTYFSLDDNGNEILPSLIKHIRNLMEENNLNEEDLIFWGASKGGTIAARLIPSFLKSKYVIIVPQRDLEIYRETRKDANDLLLQYLEINKFNWREELDINNNLKLLNKNSLVIESSNDYSSNINYNQTNNTKYIPMTIDEVHNQVTKISEPYWASKITNEVNNYESRFFLDEFKINDNRLLLKVSVGRESEIIGSDYSIVNSYIELYDLQFNHLFSTSIARSNNSENIDTFIVGDYNSIIDDYSTFISETNVIPVIKVIVKKDGQYNTFKGMVYKDEVVLCFNLKNGSIYEMNI